MEIKREKLIQAIKDNYLLVIMFVLATAIFVYQHYSSLFWDFSSYVLNGRFFFHGGTYYETLRPPLAPLLMGIFLFLGRIGEYIYIIAISLLFIYSTIKFADLISESQEDKESKRLMRIAFYFFSLSAYTLILGLREGTELLSLALIELFVIDIIKGKPRAGLFAALAFLTRYQNLVLIPFLLFIKDYKKIFKSLLIFTITILPWLLYNYFKFGNLFTGIVDAYANNVLFRDYIHTPFTLKDILTVTGLFTIFAIAGIVLSAWKIIKEKSFSKNKLAIIIALLAAVTIWGYAGIPLKTPRYLFTLVLPVAFFSTAILIFAKDKLKINQKVLSIVLVLTLIITSIPIEISLSSNAQQDNLYLKAAEDIKYLGLDNCIILSPHWVMVAYYTENVYPLGKNDITISINQNKTVLIFKDESTIDDKFDPLEIDNSPHLYETEKYMLLAKENLSEENCAQKYVYQETYVPNHCEIISQKFSRIKLDTLTLKVCNLINPKF